MCTKAQRNLKEPRKVMSSFFSLPNKRHIYLVTFIITMTLYFMWILNSIVSYFHTIVIIIIIFDRKIHYTMRKIDINKLYSAGKLHSSLAVRSKKKRNDDGYILWAWICTTGQTDSRKVTKTHTLTHRRETPEIFHDVVAS